MKHHRWKRKSIQKEGFSRAFFIILWCCSQCDSITKKQAKSKKSPHPSPSEEDLKNSNIPINCDEVIVRQVMES